MSYKSLESAIRGVVTEAAMTRDEKNAMQMAAMLKRQGKKKELKDFMMAMDTSLRNRVKKSLGEDYIQEDKEEQIKEFFGSLAEETITEQEDPTNPDTGGAEETEMGKRQLHFIKYAAGEIMDYVSMKGDMDEWFQNKLTTVHDMIRGLHSYIEGDKRLKGMVSEETMELAGVTLQNMEHCPGAVAAFKQNLKDGANEKDVAIAAQAVDAYLAIEDKAIEEGEAEPEDVEKMKALIANAKKVISDKGLKGHTYHDMHLKRVMDMLEDEDDDDEEEMNEDLKKAAAELKKYADKHGGTDKQDFHTAASHMMSGNHNALKRHIDRQDTEPREKILTTLHKHGNDIKKYGYSMREEVELDEYNTKSSKAIVTKDNKPIAIYSDLKSAQKDYHGKDGHAIGMRSHSAAMRIKKENPKIKIVEAVRSADKKPETYVGADGKPKTRMVPSDRNVIKEKSVSQAQQKAAGAALAAKRGEIKPSELVGASKEMYNSMTTKELEDFASTKHKGLPQKVDEISDKLKGRYIRKASDSHQHASNVRRDAISRGDKETADKAAALMKKRNKGVARAFGESTFTSRFKEELKEKKRAMNEVKSAPKGYHFTKDGKLKRGDADVDGPGGEKLRSDPLDKQRSKIPPLPEKNIVRGGAFGNPMPKPAPRPFPGTKKPPTFGF